MIDGSDLNLLVLNIVNEHNFKHCRLCLQSIDGNFVKFEDTLFFDLDINNFTMSELLRKLLGDEICHEIPGVDAVCKDCARKTLEIMKFIKKCEDSTNLLHNIFIGLVETLNVNIDSAFAGESLYVLVSEHESKTIVVKNKDKCHSSFVDTQYSNPEYTKVCTDTNDIKVPNYTEHEQPTCINCCETFADTYQLKEHKQSKCPDCNEYKCTAGSLKNHQVECHGMHKCKECDRSFKGLKKLQNHELKHSTKYVCSKCGKCYATKQFYLRHVQLCLKDLIQPHPIRSKIIKSHFCNKCGKGYSTPGGLRVHNRFVHGNAKPHVCPLCNKQFTAPSYLKAHMIKHTGEKNYQCEMCNRKCVSKEALLYHIRRHTGEKPCSCHLCDEKFVNTSARADHIKHKHVGPTLMCEICSRKFVTPTFLRQHIMKHHDPKNKLYTGRHQHCEQSVHIIKTLG